MRQFTPYILTAIFLKLGSFYGYSQSSWLADWDALSEVEVSSLVDPSELRGAVTPAVAVIENPDLSAPKASDRVLALRDGSSGDEPVGAFLAKEGLDAERAELSFSFYVPTPHRNGSLLVRLLNKENQTLASFQLYAQDREEGEIQLNTFGPEGDRQMPPETGIYFGHTWTPVVLKYDGLALQWSLQLGEKTFSNLPVDAAVHDTRLFRFEIHSGFGSASKTQVLIDHLKFQPTSP